ncbi:polysaccharide deacetylase family protein [Paenibacillus chitinolyticus]|uniref:polysaccharide deacetylase family protein n=1 Tax=Paenibacillus chitinolyticus TaxID=79263 RepID=UPI001C48C64D|nr:polysaccharide deacetylase family protein [Paenibacillus chitinolyticus]MBV6717023.1 polysaccharide deacetylase family protein [Paenibacillus chitinolyticus]
MIKISGSVKALPLRRTAAACAICVFFTLAPAPALASGGSHVSSGLTVSAPRAEAVNGLPHRSTASPASIPAEKDPHATAAKPRDRDYYEQRGEIVWEVPSAGKVIALTFDDGPDPVQTVQILDELKKYGAKATFFVVGKRAERFPELIKREAAEGHEIGNHTYSHPFLTNNRSTESIRSEIAATQKVIKSINGTAPVLFRPPGGYYHERLVHVSLAEGCLPILWSWHQDTEDWKAPGVNRVVNKVLNNAREGDIVLFHDHVLGSMNTVDAIRKILPELSKRGYHFVTVSELLKLRGSTSGVSKPSGSKTK